MRTSTSCAESSLLKNSLPASATMKPGILSRVKWHRVGASLLSRTLTGVFNRRKHLGQVREGLYYRNTLAYTTPNP